MRSSRFRLARWAPFVGDVSAFVVAFVIGGMATEATRVGRTGYADVNDLVGLAACLALFWRRRWPVPVAVAAIAAGVAAPLAGGAALVGVFTVATHRSGRVPFAVAGFAAVSGVVAILVFPDEALPAWANALLAVLFVATTLGWGLALRARHDRLTALTERAERLQAEHEARLAEARRAERASIAAEMHDVLAHRLSMLSLHAGAIELHPDAAPEERTNAARIVRTSAHQAIEELRAVIGVLRDEPGPATATVTPPPAITDVDQLVGECRSAGMTVDLTLPPAVRAMPGELGRHAYRIVQEGLTNARKHATGAPVSVRLAGDPQRGLTIEVCNPATPDPGPGAALPASGLGLVGLRERVELLHGTLSAGLDGGVHRLRAWLPWPA